MQIDWITVIAQIVNFLILAWLLKRFLYQPVINAMDQREQLVMQRLTEAEQREQLADQKALQFEQQKSELEQQQQTLIADAREQAEVQKQKMLEAARDEVNSNRCGR